MIDAQDEEIKTLTRTKC